MNLTDLRVGDVIEYRAGCGPSRVQARVLSVGGWEFDFRGSSYELNGQRYRLNYGSRTGEGDGVLVQLLNEQSRQQDRAQVLTYASGLVVVAHQYQDSQGNWVTAA